MPRIKTYFELFVWRAWPVRHRCKVCDAPYPIPENVARTTLYMKTTDNDTLAASLNSSHAMATLLGSLPDLMDDEMTGLGIAATTCLGFGFRSYTTTKGVGISMTLDGLNTTLNALRSLLKPVGHQMLGNSTTNLFSAHVADPKLLYDSMSLFSLLNPAFS